MIVYLEMGKADQDMTKILKHIRLIEHYPIFANYYIYALQPAWWIESLENYLLGQEDYRAAHKDDGGEVRD